MSNLQWNGDAVRAAILAETRRRLAACGLIGVAHAKALISTDGTTKTTTKTKVREAVKDEYGYNKLKYGILDHGWAAKKTRSGDVKLVKANFVRGWQIVMRTVTRTSTTLEYNTNPSRPGDPPNVQTGRLRGSVASETSGNTVRIGTNVEYGRHLELGTSRMAPRPWLRRMLLEKMNAFRSILAAPIKGPHR